MRSLRRLFAGLALAALLAAGAGTAYAVAQAGPGGMMSSRGNDTGSMMPMMGGENGMGSMMNGGDMEDSFNEDKPFDLQFIDQMTMHHEGAIMSSEHMISDSKRPELRELAANIEESQSAQIEQMRAWRGEWYPDAEQTSGMPAGMMEGMMDGSMQGMIGGDVTDEMFLRMMIPHHQMAVEMSEKALDEADHPEVENLARKIIAEQTAEIELMEGYLEEIEAAEEG